MSQGRTELSYGLTFQDVIEILRLVDAGSFAELRLELDGLDLAVACRRAGAPADAPEGVAVDAAPPAGDAESAPRGAPTGQRVDGAPSRQPPDDAAVPDGAVALRAPLGGIFYAAPAPGAPPFVEVGASVREGDRVGLIEVMKLFTPVVAACAGVVSEMRAKNEQLVHSDQILAIIVPSEPWAGGAPHRVEGNGS